MRHVLWGLTAAALLLTPACKKDEKKDPATATGANGPATNPDTPDQPEPTADSKLVERGKYLTDLMGCVMCHTAMDDKGSPMLDKAWAGGLEVTEAFGTWRSANITQDEATGIGTWTDEQIIDGIRKGLRSNGTQMFMIMPYLYYNVMADDDARAVVAFLRTIKPISNKVERAADLKLPEIPAPEPKGTAVPVSDPVAYGQYLTSLMHCEMCHTPMSKDGMPDTSKRFAGGFPFELPPMGTGVLYSTNITQDKKTGIGEWSDADIATSLREMKKKDGSVIQGPMALYQPLWIGIHDDDMGAIVAFVKSIPATANKVPKSTFKPHAAPPSAPGDEATGEGDDADDEDDEDDEDMPEDE